MKHLREVIFGLIVVFGFSIYLNACRPIRNLTNRPETWQGQNNYVSTTLQYDSTRKTVFIIADHESTEIFDMLAPFYLFNQTGKANVYIVSKTDTPILVKRDLFVRPQLTLNQADAVHLQPDVIVIPALSKRTPLQDTALISWIRNHVHRDTKLLTICDGAVTGAATGLFDGKPITCHASDFEHIKAQFSKPQWVKGVPVTKSGNLFSTAGVSNAVEGSLVVINELFGAETMEQIMKDINYPKKEIKTSHKSVAITAGDKFTFLKKAMFNKNKRIGLLLEDGVNEFMMASLIDTYNRTLPYSFSAFNFTRSTVQTKFGLTIISNGKDGAGELDELHILSSNALSEENASGVKNVKIIRHPELQTLYPFDSYFHNIGKQYGKSFAEVVKVSLDYN